MIKKLLLHRLKNISRGRRALVCFSRGDDFTHREISIFEDTTDEMIMKAADALKITQGDLTDTSAVPEPVRTHVNPPVEKTKEAAGATEKDEQGTNESGSDGE